MKIFGLSLAGALLSACYWWLVVTVNYGLFGGDVAPDATPPSETTLMLQNLITLVIGVIVYAFLSMAWRRVTARFVA